MTDTLKYINIAMESWGLLFCLLAGAILLLARHIDRRTKRYFLMLFAFLFLDLLSNMGGLFLRGRTDLIGGMGLRISNFSEYFFGDALTLVLTLYLLFLIDKGKKEMTQSWRRAAWSIFGLAVMLLVFSQFMGIFYTVDASGIYHRGRLFWLSQVIAIASLLLDVVLILRFRERLSHTERIGFCVYVCVPIVAIFLQLFIYGVYFLLIASTLSAVFLMGTTILEQTEQHYRTEQELAQMRAAIMLSQVKPHFLYNALTAIAQLCEQDAHEAKQATIAFADYLRMNINTLNEMGRIPFAKELQHIETYLYLEQLRFGEDLHVEMQIEAMDFSLPALTIQPLVENAVKWGVGQKEEGGTVWLRTIAREKGVEITVSDDGIGFDVAGLPQEGAAHLGLRLVHDRLQMICGAKIQVKSRIGQGTEIRIFLPLGEEE